jgi:transcriptional repressor NrdR
VIGEMAMERLRHLDQIAYMRFALVYQSFEDLGQLRREVDRLLAGRGEASPGQTQLALELEGEPARAAAPRRRGASAGPKRAPRARREDVAAEVGAPAVAAAGAPEPVAG